jgi:SAM-dependent methyltransferase
MQISEQVRRGYEARPYPAGDEKALTDRAWRIAPMEWIQALWRDDSSAADPKRILVAGCGAGTEAFNMKRRFPHGEIVGVDFSARSIALAQELQKKEPLLRDIRFVAGDLSRSSLSRKTGAGFDFISCHGVLSYIPEPEQALLNLAQCLKPDGAFYMGVNGADHISNRLRRGLPQFGFDMSLFQDSPRLHDALKLCDAALGLEPPQCMAGQPPEYLSGDVFGPLIHNWTFSQWKTAAGNAGLHVAGSFLAMKKFRPIANGGMHPVLMPKSRAEVIELLEELRPSSFHSLLFTAAPAMNPPWDKPDKLLSCRIGFTGLYTARVPKPAAGWNQARNMKLKSAPINTVLEFSMPEWELEILRKCDKKGTLREIIKSIPRKIPFEELKEFLYLLHQLLAIQVQP